MVIISVAPAAGYVIIVIPVARGRRYMKFQRVSRANSVYEIMRLSVPVRKLHTFPRSRPLRKRPMAKTADNDNIVFVLF